METFMKPSYHNINLEVNKLIIRMSYDLNRYRTMWWAVFSLFLFGFVYHTDALRLHVQQYDIYRVCFRSCCNCRY